jgi:DNA-binding LacI/PurR family transcriptional regulator
MATQKELAKYAGVSAGTVSNVISGSTRVKEGSRKKVLEAIQALNYQPNLIARSLKTNRTNTLGIIIPDITIPFLTKLIRGAAGAAREAGQFLLVLDSQGSTQLETEMIALLRHRVDGILLIPSGGEAWSRESAAEIAEGPPLVCVDRRPDGLNVDAVSVDDVGAAEMGVSHLIEKGHQNIALACGPLILKNEQDRVRGYKKALSKSNLKLNESLIWEAGFNPGRIDIVCQEGFLHAKCRPTAIFSTNGVTGLGVLRSLYAMGLSIPEDMAFATIDELTPDEIFRPGITSVTQPALQIGERAIQVLIERIAHKDEKHRASVIRLSATLNVRESSRLRHGVNQPQMPSSKRNRQDKA